MRISVFDRFGALNSGPVWQALRAGCAQQGIQCSSHDLSADVAVIWSVVWAGRMRANREVWQQFRQSDRPVIVAEVGTLDRGRTWKLGLNGTGLASLPKDLSRDRASDLSISVRPWRATGDHVLIGLQRQDSEQWTQAPNDWLDRTVRQLKNCTDREIVIRPHPRYKGRVPAGCVIQQPRPVPGTYDSFDLVDGLAGAWAVVNWSSGIAITAALHGIPVFVGPDSLALPVGTTDLSRIETPPMPDRERWLRQVGHSEWTLAELATGQPLQALLDHRV